MFRAMSTLSVLQVQRLAYFDESFVLRHGEQRVRPDRVRRFMMWSTRAALSREGVWSPGCLSPELLDELFAGCGRLPCIHYWHYRPYVVPRSLC